MPAEFVPRVIVKFKDELVNLEVDNAADQFLARLKAGEIPGTSWPQLVAQHDFQGLTIEKLLTALTQAELLKLMNLAFHRDPSYRFFAPNLLTYFAIPRPPKVKLKVVAEVLSTWEPVERAYIAEAPSDLPAVNKGANPAWGQKDTHYLVKAPAGIDAEFAWDQRGGDGGKTLGINLQLFDIESNWDLTHPDLTPSNPQWSGIGHRKPGWENHGTKVLGIVIASDQNPPAPYDKSSLGIAPNLAATNVASYWRDDNNIDHFNTILAVINRMQFGDVLLLETQVNLNDENGNPILEHLPVEYFKENFDAIRLGTALGIVTVEAAGNKDHFLDNLGIPWLTRNSDPKLDSGAILVSAATPWVNGGSSTTPPDYIHAPFITSTRQHNFGSRIDCYAWCDNIYTTEVGGYGNFGDTSGASAIIAGAALSLQGMAEAQLGYRFSPLQIRSILNNPDPATGGGTPSKDPDNDKLGVMPDLRNIVEKALCTTPDVYIRDFVDDDGDPHTGPISMSPDIILRRTPFDADPAVDLAAAQAAYGEGSGTEGNSSLSEDAVPGQNHCIYVRVRNRGGVLAQNVKATVYYSDPTLLVTPDLWNKIGETVIKEVPPGDVLTVSPAIKWSAIPGTGHYCFVASIGNPQDPEPPKPGDFLGWPGLNAWDLYQRFIRENNNVTWRNFDVVDNTPSTSGFTELDFMMNGTWSKAVPMRIEVISRFPSEARIFLHVPEKDWKTLSALKELGRIVEIESEKRGRVPAIQLNPHGRSRTTEILFPKTREFRSQCLLLVDIPERLRKFPYEVSIRQLSGDQEVGRLTWRLAQQQETRRRQQVTTSFVESLITELRRSLVGSGDRRS